MGVAGSVVVGLGAWAVVAEGCVPRRGEAAAGVSSDLQRKAKGKARATGMSWSRGGALQTGSTKLQ